MKAVLLIAHGSRKEQSNEIFFDVIEMVSELMPDTYIDGAFMSFHDVDIDFKLEEFIKKGIDEIVIVPYLLFAGNHVKQTIPYKVDKFLENYPDVKVSYKNSIGIDKRLAEIVVDRINE